MILLLSLLATAPAEAKAKDGCEWIGDGVDAFTGQDNRRLTISYYFGVASFTMRPAVDGKVSWDIGIRGGGAIAEPFTKPVQMLLANGSILEIPPDAPVTGVMSASSEGVATYYAIKATVGVDVMQGLVDAGGVTKFRFPLPSGDYEMGIGEKHYRDLPAMAACAIMPTAAATK